MDRVATGRPAGPRRRDPVLTGLGMVAAAVVVGFGLDLGGRVAQVVVCWVLMAVVHAVLLHCALRVTRVPGLPRHHRRLWRTNAFVGGAYLAGDLGQLVAIPADPTSLTSAYGTPWQSAWVALGTVTLVGVMLTSPLGLRSPAERERFRFDVATIM